METHGNSVRLGRSGGVSRVDLRGVSKSRKFKWLLKIGADNGVTALIKKKS